MIYFRIFLSIKIYFILGIIPKKALLFIYALNNKNINDKISLSKDLRSKFLE
jgi:hypothetical protein